MNAVCHMRNRNLVDIASPVTFAKARAKPRRASD